MVLGREARQGEGIAGRQVQGRNRAGGIPEGIEACESETSVLGGEAAICCAMVRFKGLAKNTALLVTLFALLNLWMVRRRMLATTASLRPVGWPTREKRNKATIAVSHCLLSG